MAEKTNARMRRMLTLKNDIFFSLSAVDLLAKSYNVGNLRPTNEPVHLLPVQALAG